MKIGYARVSASDQNLNLQIDALKAAGCELIFQDFGISGTVRDRPELAKALAALNPGDTLTVWRLDRLGRSLLDLLEIVNGLKARNIGLHSLTEVIDTSTPIGELLLHVLAALAQFERQVSRERCRAGIDAAKRRGKRFGRPRKLSPERLAQARELLDGGQTQAAVAGLLDVHPATLCRALERDSGNSTAA
jgi:DNA invertase Pin-like site-specific DNA recombinase